MDDNAVEQTARKTRPEADVDRRRIARFLAGDRSALDELVSAHQRRVARLVYRLLGWPADVEDVVQDVFVAMVGNLHRFRNASSFSTWLTTIAVNKCRSHQRRRLLWRRGWAGLIERFQEADSNRRTEDSPESHHAVREAVRTLPRKFREPIVLRYFEQMSVGEVADVLGLSRGAVQVRLSRARQRLKEKLERHRNEESA